MPGERVQRQIDRLLDAAEQALEQRDWAQVLQHAQDALRLDPDNGDARAFVAAAQREPRGAVGSGQSAVDGETEPSSAVGEDALSSRAPETEHQPDPRRAAPNAGAGGSPALRDGDAQADRREPILGGGQLARAPSAGVTPSVTRYPIPDPPRPLLPTPSERSEAMRHLDIAIAEFRDMKMQPALERALRHKEVLKA